MTSYEKIVSVIRQQGERVTIQRQWVIEALTATGRHMTIQDLSAEISRRHGGKALPEPTIYRILQKLKDLEVVSQTDMAGAGVVYQVIGTHRHHHLICLHCGSTTDVPDSLFDELRAELKLKHQFRARIDHMAIYGYCANCASFLEAK